MYKPNLKAHPVADMFPMLDDAQLLALGNDMAKNGQQMPVMVWNGQIVDGRNRWEAGARLKIPVKTEDIHFESEAECIRYIISTNIHRRHLTDEQRDQIGARLVTMTGQGGDRSNPQNAGCVGVAAAADMVHSTPARIERARTIERADPKLAEKVISGEISKGRALKEIKARAATPTDPCRADDKVVDAAAEAHADGYTKKMEAAWSAYWKLDETEQTAFHERQKQKGMV